MVLKSREGEGTAAEVWLPADKARVVPENGLMQGLELPLRTSDQGYSVLRERRCDEETEWA